MSYVHLISTHSSMFVYSCPSPGIYIVAIDDSTIATLFLKPIHFFKSIFLSNILAYKYFALDVEYG